MKRIGITYIAGLPHASMVQDAGTPLRTLHGDMALNLRETGTGGLMADTVPAECGRCSHRPVFADTRQGVTNILTLGTDGTLYREVSLGADGTRLESAVALGKIAPGDCRLARVGNFVAVSDGAGTLSYLYWEDTSGIYRWLGAVPELPPFSVETPEVRAVSGAVEAVAFGEPVSDMRGGVPAAVKKAVGAAVERGVNALHDRAAASGLYSSPVLVRLAVRLWDGSLLHLSEPVLVSCAAPLQPGRVSLPLAVATGGMTGTLKAPLTLDAFTLKVTADTSQLGGWRDIVRGIEVWVTPPQRIMDEGGTPSVSYNESGGAHTLNVLPAFVSGEAQARTLFTSVYRRVAMIPVSEGAQTVYPAYSGDGESLADYGALRRRGVLSASAMTGHGGFLHLSGCRRVLPLPAMPRGEYGATQRAACRVAVKFGDGEDARVVSAEGEVTCDDGVLLPLFSYPDTSATEITIQLTYPDGRLYEREFALCPAGLGEKRAVWIPPSLGGIALLPVPELSEFRAGERVIEESGGTVVTMARGNPFVPYCETPGAAGSIMHIEAQRSGGGAYTRQYLYLFSDTGVSALTHSMTGEHTNCRPISGRVVTDRRRVCSCDEGVFAVCDDGSLVRFRDSKVHVLMRGVGRASRLLCSQESGEIWLLREGVKGADIVAAEPTARGEVAVRRSDFIPGDILECRGLALYVTESDGEWRLSIHGAGAEPPLVAQWESPVLEYDGGGVTQLRLGMEGEADAEIRLDLLPPDVPAGGSGVELLTAQIRGGVAEDVTVPFMLPEPRLFPRIKKNRLRLRLRGNPGTLLSVGFDTVES